MTITPGTSQPTTDQPAEQTDPITTQAPEPTASAPTATPEALDTAGDLYAACAAGTVRLYRQRANGTLRAMPWLTTKQIENATWALEELADGATLDAVCAVGAWSRSTIRRMLDMIDTMAEIEAGEWDDLYDEDTDALIVYTEDEADEQ